MSKIFSNLLSFIVLMTSIYILEIIFFSFKANIIILIILFLLICLLLYLKTFFQVKESSGKTNILNMFKAYIAIYLIVLFLITSIFRGHDLNWLLKNNGQINLIPIINTFKEFQNLTNFQRTPFFTLLLGNLIMYIPMTYLIPRSSNNQTFKLTIFYILFLATIIELLQHFFGTGVFDIDDIILNTSWSIIFYFLFNKSSLSKILDSIFLFKFTKLTFKEYLRGTIELIIIILLLYYLIHSYWFII